MSEHPDSFPKVPRLVDDPNDPVGEILRHAANWSESVDERAAWRRLERRRARERKRRMVFTVAGVAAAAAFMVLVRTRLLPDGAEFEVSSDSVSIGASVKLPVPSAEQPQLPASAPKPQNSVSPWRSVNRIAPESHAEGDCRALVRVGRSREAMGCYERLSTGSGITAEVALHELARLRAEALNDPRGALQALAEHRKRFPEGALRGEVDLATVRVLSKLDRHDEVLRESEALLERPWGREHASELHRLRGTIYADRLHDCSRALSEFVALVGEPNAAGDEAEFRRADCLRQLGRHEDARGAFEAYLRRDRPLRESEAKAQLGSLPDP